MLEVARDQGWDTEKTRALFERAIAFEPLPEDDPKRRRPDISKARKLLGWEPKIALSDGLRQTAEYFKNHQLNPVS